MKRTVRAWLDSTQIPSPDHNGHTHIRYNHDDERYIGYTTTTRQQLQVYLQPGSSGKNGTIASNPQCKAVMPNLAEIILFNTKTYRISIL